MNSKRVHSKILIKAQISNKNNNNHLKKHKNRKAHFMKGYQNHNKKDIKINKSQNQNNQRKR